MDVYLVKNYVNLLIEIITIVRWWIRSPHCI